MGKTRDTPSRAETRIERARTTDKVVSDGRRTRATGWQASALSTLILASLERTPGQTDRELTDAIKGLRTHPSQINQECRLLQGRRILIRRSRADGKIGNFPAGTDLPEPPPVDLLAPAQADSLSEDEVKHHLLRWLEADGWTVEVAWGKARGLDIAARRGEENWIIEVETLRPLTTTLLPSASAEAYVAASATAAPER